MNASCIPDVQDLGKGIYVKCNAYTRCLMNLTNKTEIKIIGIQIPAIQVEMSFI